MSDVRRVASGLERLGEDPASVQVEGLRQRLAAAGVAVGQDVTASTLAAAAAYERLVVRSDILRSILIIALSVLGLAWSVRRIAPPSGPATKSKES
jgi:phosphate transport system permease protein